MFEVRSDEPDYAFLQDRETQTKNRYGKDIDLAATGDALHEQSLNINHDEAIGDNPNRYKQHGFFFTADNCIGCHACESACSEKNDNPAHIAFRSVGYVEGGTYPDYQRINISMACNHCDDPVCLKGCPTRAYTKFAEYGAVLQDPEICFGCGYCTWVCPYNAPQLDPVKGQVSKCNMCVDRLEVGLKPSCVSACLGKALDFGVIENIPENRVQAKTEIPGFPTVDITHPNIRFQQTRTTHREMTRTDSVPVKYHRDDQAGLFKPVVDKKDGEAKQWNLRKLLTSHESAHVIFTLCTQATVGAFLLMLLGPWLGLPQLALVKQAPVFLPLLATIAVLCTLGLYKLNMHLGKPHRFYRGFNNLRLSPVSREIAGVSLFYTGLLGYSVLAAIDTGFTDFIAGMFALLSLIGGPVGLFYMYKLYRIPARPFWDHKQTGTAFVGAALSLGSLILGAVAIAALPLDAEGMQPLLQTLASTMLVGFLLEGIGHLLHARDMQASEDEGAASYYRQTTQFGKSFQLRNALLAVAIVLAASIMLAGLSGVLGMLAGLLLALATLISSVFGRSLFFVLVIPTTMPGAFFWKNPGFVEHARETGLADAPQHGIVYERHHAFKVDELVQTVKETSLADMIEHAKSILGK
ncbi:MULTISPECIES: DmsC/YnfH family molybdoenzyme membrane anchor subunit [Methylomonas]|uniref:Aspartate carbamoyltransferase n=2 Tax=Methylomonas TaxID=416 RepID=A0A126T3I0_9GAMM|nr:MULTISPECIES: DmsC/YnfH family molybdoenzyme membrane anchor subunit [Methylomonas]AMK76629.1 aspartate carbamoyltransferase [Methylomonas denitrificans]OAH96285.1 aspartate carbamoyltransferase [Methylomonas methanica]TCV73147.1 nitrate reductase (quinol-dependent) transmembrane subunit [Methylomonas methanica]